MKPCESLISRITELSSTFGFADVGVVDITGGVPKVEQERYLARLRCQGFATMSYLERNMELRFNPAYQSSSVTSLHKTGLSMSNSSNGLLPGAKSMIIFLVPFGSNSRMSAGETTRCSSIPNHEHSIKDAVEEIISICDQNGRIIQGATASQFAMGEDYHKVIKGRLRKIIDELKKLNPEFEGRALVDSAPLLERYWASRAGLGFIGKNNFLISPKAGIRNFIGSILCNLPIENFHAPASGICASSSSMPPEAASARRVQNRQTLPNGGTNPLPSCGSCHRCINACPSGALSAPFTLDAAKCISYRTIEAPEADATIRLQSAENESGTHELPQEKNMDNGVGEYKPLPAGNRQEGESLSPQVGKGIFRIFGCDACMDACPWNRFNLTGWREFEPATNPMPISHFHRR